eukprot:8818406-Lingulodinium_polyedra.AAC.1
MPRQKHGVCAGSSSAFDTGYKSFDGFKMKLKRGRTGHDRRTNRRRSAVKAPRTAAGYTIKYTHTT